MQTSSSHVIQHPSCSDCSLVSFCFSRASQKTSIALSFLKQQHNIKKQQTVSTSKKAFSLYMVKEGALKAFTLQPQGKEQIVSFYFPGEIIGLEAINQKIYPFTIESLTPAILCEIPYEKLLSLGTAFPQLYVKLLQLASQRLNMGHYISILRADQRIAGFLLELSTRLHCTNQQEGFLLPMARQAIGDYLGLAGETVIRILNRLHQQKIITMKNKHIKVKDTAALLCLAQGESHENLSH